MEGPGAYFGLPQWIAGAYLGVLAAAALATVLVGERIGFSLIIGVVAVAIGIWLSSTESQSRS